MDKNIAKMLDGECPQCKSSVGDIMSYLPHYNTEQNLVTIDILCENCGCTGRLVTKLITSKFTENIG